MCHKCNENHHQCIIKALYILIEHAENIEELLEEHVTNSQKCPRDNDECPTCDEPSFSRCLYNKC